MGRICFHPLVLSGWRTKQPSPEYFLLLVQVPNSEFLQKKKFQRSSGFAMVLSSHSRCMILTWVRVFDPLFPTSKADIWSLWVGRVLHTLVTYIAKPNGDPWRIGTQPHSDLVECQRDGRRWTHNWKGNLVFYLNSLFATLWESGIFFSHFQLFFKNNPLSLLLKWF